MKDTNNSKLENKPKCSWRNSISCCKSLSKTSIAIIFLTLGVGSTILIQDYLRSKKTYDINHFSNFDIISNKELFSHNSFFEPKDIFSEMESMQKRMNESFVEHQKHMEKIFEDVQKNNKMGSKISISTKEDEQSYSYILHFSGFNKDELEVSLKDNILTFLAKNKKENSDKKSESNSSSNLYYSFSIPDYDTKKEPVITKEENKITVKLFKIPRKNNR